LGKWAVALERVRVVSDFTQDDADSRATLLADHAGVGQGGGGDSDCSGGVYGMEEEADSRGKNKYPTI
jgi:hypothetical protein